MGSKSSLDIISPVWKYVQKQSEQFRSKFVMRSVPDAGKQLSKSDSSASTSLVVVDELSDDANTSSPSVKNALQPHRTAVASMTGSQSNWNKPTRKEITQITRDILKSLRTDERELLRCTSVKLRDHFLNYPASKMVAIEDGVSINRIKKHAKSADKELQGIMNQCLALCGNVSETRNPNGICILTIDGGGTRGIMGLEILAALEKSTGRKVCELFDLIVGVSTGSIIATLIGAKAMSIMEAKEAYLNYCSKVFNISMLDKISTVGGRIAYLNSNTTEWTNILKEALGVDFAMIDSASDEKIPKVAIISLITNTSQLFPFIFRNYEHPSFDNRYRGSAKYKFWEAIRASTAAPTYFEELKLGEFMHQDGGILLNNPTSVAIQEAKRLWPHEDFHCVISIGNGQFLPEIEPKINVWRDITLSTYQPVSWMRWFTKNYDTMMESATETELSHHCISDLIPSGRYFRLNPYMSIPGGYALDTKDPILLDLMKRDAELYIRRNRMKINEAAGQLKKEFNANIWKSLKRKAFNFNMF